MNIKVAIRVRPFNQRELDLKTELCVDMSDNQTYILKEGSSEIERTFTYDNCFWSHDEFDTDEHGYHFPVKGSRKYWDQERVYNVLGKDVLNNALNGYNCCLFAYGQTGSGKSYSIFGYGENKGIVPKICNQFLDGTTLVEDDKRSFSLSISMLEIYNEKIQDLLIPIAKRAKGGLKVRENNKLGVFVEDLTKREVRSYVEIEEVIELGNKHKTLGATLMNATSSRAHTIITLELVQREVGIIKTTQKDSVIYLVDLAGSEKVAKTEAKGDRLKEACSINKSLTVLGIVIHQLYLRSEGEKVIVSYRDSALTRILQNALGGNSVTTMICAISPARDNIDETLSTLRYADQAKQIKQNARINESETDKMIRELMEENDKLKNLLAQLQGNKDRTVADDVAHQIRELENVISFKANFNQGPSHSHSFSKRPSISIGVKEKPNPKLLTTNPHMYNLNEDPLLNQKIIYDFTESPSVLVGRQSDKDNLEDSKTTGERKIVLNGVGILEEHARINYSQGNLSIVTYDIDAASAIFINGESLDSHDPDGAQKGIFTRSLIDLDRIIIGTSSTFLVRLPNETGLVPEDKKVGGKDVDWEFCQMEKFKKQEKTEREKLQVVYQEKEVALKDMEKQLKENFDREKDLYEQKICLQQEEYERMIESMQRNIEERENELSESQQMIETENFESIKLLQNEQKTKELEFQVRLNALHKETQLLKQIQAINSNLEKKLINYYHKIKEANYIAQELNRNIEFVPFVASLNLLASLNQKTTTPDLIVNVKVINYEEGWVNYWPLEKFDNRLILIRDAIEYFFSHNKIQYNEQNDPFWDPEEFFLHGQAFCLLKNVLYRFELTHKVGILGYEGDIGYIVVQLMPIDDEGKEIDEEEIEEEIEEPDDLIIKNMSCHYRINIEKIIIYDINNLKGKTGYLNYEVMTLHNTEEYSTKWFKIADNQIDLNYSQTIKIPRVNNDLIDHYMHKNIQFKFYVDKIEKVPCKGKNPPPIIHKHAAETGKGPTDAMIPKKSMVKKTSINNKSTVYTNTQVHQPKSTSSNVCRIM
jgi:kinesin family protein 13